MAPIKIDGTDITGATIGGQDVQEITVDGQTVFAASTPAPTPITHRFPLTDNNTSTVNDVIGTATGNVRGASVATRFDGEFCYEFDGNDDIILDNDVYDNLDDQSDISIALLFNCDDLSRENINLAGPNAPYAFGLSSYFADIPEGEIAAVVLQNSNGRVFASTPIVENQWHAVVGVFDASAGEIRLFLDGSLADTQSYDGTYDQINNSNRYTIGSRDGGGKGFFTGKISDHLIYHRALSNAEAESITTFLSLP